jgi:hypothetical protein
LLLSKLPANLHRYTLAASHGVDSRIEGHTHRCMPTRLTIAMRVMIALLVGVMAALPVPVRMLAHSAAGHLAQVRQVAGHHAHDTATGHHGDAAAHDDHRAPAGETKPQPPADSGIPCHSAPCCMAVTQPPPSAPDTVLLLLERLGAAPAQIIVAIAPDPAVPPPRLHA